MQDAPSAMVTNKSMKEIACSNAMITNPNPCNKTACSMPRDYLRRWRHHCPCANVCKYLHNNSYHLHNVDDGKNPEP
jgi:hypothetical protein